MKQTENIYLTIFWLVCNFIALAFSVYCIIQIVKW